MVPLNLPKAKLKLIKRDNQVFVWDVFRKKNLLITPEEWVRQHILHYMVNELNYPINLIATEFAIKVNGLTRRCDAVVFDANGQPKLIVECKEPRVDLDENVMHQVAQYNFKLNVDYLILTNGLNTVTAFVNREGKSLDFFKEIPNFKSLI